MMQRDGFMIRRKDYGLGAARRRLKMMQRDGIIMIRRTELRREATDFQMSKS